MAYIYPTFFKCVLPDFAYLTSRDFHLLDTETHCCKANHNDLTSRSTVFLENLITCLLQKPNVHYHVHKSTPPIPELSHRNSDRILPTSFLKNFLKSIVSILPLKRRLSKLPRPFRFSDQNFARTLISPIRATCPAVSIFVR
jgi:hypothetical protein